MNTPPTTPIPVVVTSPARQRAITGLAIVGFVALIVAGISLAVYSARFIPGAATRIGTAAVYLGSVFNPSPEPGLAVVSTPPAASTTISFGTISSTAASTTTVATTVVATTSVATTQTTPAKPSPATSGANTSTTYQVAGTPAPVYSGLSDLSVNISAIGYLATSSADTFVGAGTVPQGARPAVQFTIKNVGTNWTGTWRFSASIPTRTSYVFQSDPQQSLAPGDSIDYTLGFDQASTGSSQTVSISANFDHAAPESNMNNNSASANLTVL